MRWLVNLVAGQEIAALDKQVEAWRGRALSAETTVELVKEILKREQERGERLTSELSDRIRPQSIKPPDMKPVGQSISSWPRIKRELEKQNRVKENAEVSREEIEKTIRGQI
jgi:hypothetical protein